MFTLKVERWSFLAAITAGLLLLATPVQANAANPACPSFVSSATSFNIPSSTAAERKLWGNYEVDTLNLLDWTSVGKAQVSLYRANSQKRYWKESWSIDSYFSNSFWVRLNEKPSDYELKATFSFDNGRQTCDVNKERNIRVYQGKKIRTRIKPSVGYLNNGPQVVWWCPGGAPRKINGRQVWIDIDTPWDYDGMFISEQCTGRRSTSDEPVIRSALWTARFDGSTNTVDFTLKKKPGLSRMRITVSHGGYNKKSVRLAFKWISRPARRIYWTDVDAYWNYCISKGRPIKSENGQLYCWTKDKSRYKVRVLSRSG